MFELSPNLLQDWLNLVRIHSNGYGLPLKQKQWKGAAGNWAGVGTGSSIDFQDHRQYLPGDDPRYINWQAYARTEQYSMKLYREEVSPCVDLVIDASSSMILNSEKAQRTWELIYLILHVSLRDNTLVRCYRIDDKQAQLCDIQQLLSGQIDENFFEARGEQAPALFSVPFRTSSIRVFISDCLYLEDPSKLLQFLGSKNTIGIVLSPSSPEESNPDWEGNIEIKDCESQFFENRYIYPNLIKKYLEAYDRHFRLWSDASLQYGIRFSLCPSDQKLDQLLSNQILRSGALEPRA